MNKLLKEKRYKEFDELVETNNAIVDYLTYKNKFEQTMSIEYDRDNEIIDYLSKHKHCDVTTPDIITRIVFHFSVQNRNIRSFDLLVIVLFSIKCTLTYTLLHFTAKMNDRELVEFLLTKTPNNRNGKIP